MIGIVLWSDPNDRKAVFWCEDHGDLAYYTGSLDRIGACSTFTAGDMVQFDVYCETECRRAANPSLVQQNACEGLDHHLRQRARETDRKITPDTGGKVLAFRAKPSPQARSEFQKTRLKS